MKKSIPFSWFIPAVVILMAVGVNGQQAKVMKMEPASRSKISFSDIEEYDLLYPQTKPRGSRIKYNALRTPQLPVDPEKIVYKSPKMEMEWKSVSKEASPAPETDFAALGDNGNSIPPDVNGAVGPEHLMVTLNTQIRIMDREGNPISTVLTGSFWQGVPGSSGVFDPKILFDPYAQRWIFVMCSAVSPAPENTKLMVAVSETSDPTGNWYRYSFDGDPNDELWLDYPNVGYNGKWLVVAGNMVASVPQHAVVYVFNKQDLYDYELSINYSRIEVLDGFSLVPAVVMDEDEEDLYVVNHAGGDVDGYGYLNLRKVTGDVNEPVLEDIGLSGIPYPWNEWSYFEEGDFAPQLGSDELINTVDARFENMVFRNGKLWCVHHVYLPADEPTHSAVQWWELDTEGTILQWGREDGEEEGMSYTFASIAVNAKEDILIGYGSFSTEQYASASYSFRYAEDPPNTLQTRYQFKDGLAPYYKTFSGDKNRWGDYTMTCVDPLNDLDFWTIQEYAELPVSGQDRWGTWWAKINDEAKPEAHFSSNITTVPVGSGADFYDNSLYEPDSWQWIFEGGNPSTSTEQNPEDIVYETAGFYDVTLIAGNLHGTDTLTVEAYIEASTTILPEVAFVASDTIPCPGDVVAFEDQSVYNPVSWLWEFSPDDVTFVNSTDENSQNPEVIFNLSQAYQVTLTATNNNGSASLTKTGFVRSGGMELPYEETFESLTLAERGWSVENPDGELTWAITPADGTEPGGLAAYMNIRNYNNALDERDGLISPPLNFSTVSNVHLQFEFAYSQRYASYSDSLIVYVSSDCGTSWERIIEMYEDGEGSFATAGPMLTNFYPEGPDDWCGSSGNPECVVADLSAWSGMEGVRLKFETVNRYGNNVFLDNILLTPEMGENETVAGHFYSIFPNPAGDRLYVMLEGDPGNEEMEIFDMTGRMVINKQITGPGPGTLSMDLSGLNPGIYFIRIGEGEKGAVRKFIKN